MKKHLLLVFAATYLAGCSSGGSSEATSHVGAGDSIAISNPGKATSSSSEEVLPFIKNGYEQRDLFRADLNGDGTEDAILILKVIGEDSHNSDENRPLLLLIRDMSGKLSLAAENDKIVYCSGCGGVFGDPYDGITAEGNTFTVNHFGGSSSKWRHDFTFRYDVSAKDWFLQESRMQSFSPNNDTSEFADAMIEEVPEILTEKDFGVVRLNDYMPL